MIKVRDLLQPFPVRNVILSRISLENFLRDKFLELSALPESDIDFQNLAKMMRKNFGKSQDKTVNFLKKKSNIECT